MAKLTPELFTEGKPLSHYVVHAPMEADYHVFHDGDSPILLIRTFSSAERKKEGKACQNIQIDRDMARVLVNIMKESGLIE